MRKAVPSGSYKPEGTLFPQFRHAQDLKSCADWDPELGPVLKRN